MGTNKAALIRFCTQTFLEYFESRGGVAALPLDWREIMTSQDGRTSARLAEHPPASHAQTGINIGAGSLSQKQTTYTSDKKRPEPSKKKKP